jgi:hypothetical protein
MSKRIGLRAKLRAHLRAKEAGRREYKHADELMAEILQMMKPGEESRFDATGRKAKLVDNFAEKHVVFRAHGIHRYEIEIVES